MRKVAKRLALLGIATVLVAGLTVAGLLAVPVQEARAQMDTYFPDSAGAVGDSLSLADLSDWQVEALLRVEDPSFRSHSGIDLSTPGGGITTITQALVKRTFMFPFRPGPWSKLEQSAIARFAIDPLVPKDRQLETFFNIAYFGEGDGGPVLGFADAARTYFDAPVAELDSRQYLSLIAMLIAPNALHPGRDREALLDRVTRIEALLAGHCRPEGLMDVWLKACAGGKGIPRSGVQVPDERQTTAGRLASALTALRQEKRG